MNEQGTSLSLLDIRGHLASTELFKTLEEHVLDEIATQVEIIRVPGGDLLFQQGEAGDSLYIVINGRLRVSVRRERNHEEVVAEVGRDEMVGEIALLTGGNRTATVRAIRDTILIRLSNEGCYRIAERHPLIVLQIARTLARRLASTNRDSRMRTPLVNLALIPTSPDVELSDFAAQLGEALSAVGSILLLNRRRVESVWKKEGIGELPTDSHYNIKFENWLNDQESKYDFIVYEADQKASNWTQRCIRQADRVLLVGDSRLTPQLGVLEAELLHPGVRRTMACVELVLVRPKEESNPIGTTAWLEKRDVSAHYHIRQGVAADFARLARLLTGHGVGVALGGGGLRGLAHIGVLRALQESGILIDFVGGTSMGSIMAAQFALGWDYERMLHGNRKMWRESWPMNDYTIPLIACLSGEKLDAALKTMCEDAQIEDLCLNYFCVSTNLTTAGLAIHQDGLLWKRLRASCSLPGIMPPVFDNGAMLVDGAVLNNVPGDIMKRLCGGRVMAVDVSPREDVVFKAQYSERPPTREILWGRINPFAEKPAVPSLFDIVSRAAMISNLSNANQVKDQVEWYMDVPLDQFGMSDSKSFQRIIDTGYDFAQRKIEEWKPNVVI